METEKYKLEIHIDSEELSVNDLKSKVNDILNDYVDRVELKFDAINNDGTIQYNKIFIQGSLEDVDECHAQLQTKIFTQEPLNFYRCIDEVGEEIRYQAYPILAEIEQKIRSFISRALADIWGFNWWNTHPPN